MVYEATITKSDSTQIKYDLKSRSNLADVDPTKKVVLFFNNGKVFKGFTDGGIDEDSNFCVRANTDDKFCAALPFDRLLGWAYEDEGRHKLSLWNKLRKYWSQYWWFWIFWTVYLIYVLSF